MPLPPYSRTIDRGKVKENIRALESEGYPRPQAIAIAFDMARKVYFKRHPEGALPEWLAYQAGMRLRAHYGPDGAPVRGNPTARRQRGAVPLATRDAASLFTRFTGHTADRVVKVTVPGAGFTVGLIVGQVLELELDAGDLVFDAGDYPAMAVSSSGGRAAFIGGDWVPVKGLDNVRVSAIVYQTVRDGRRENYRHPFKNSARPLLTVIDGRTARMSGGSFRFTERGYIG